MPTIDNQHDKNTPAPAEALSREQLEAERDAYRIALDDAVAVLELVMERGQILARMTQPDMSGRHPLQSELDEVEYKLRRQWPPYKLWPVLQTARAALAGSPS